MTRIIKCSLFVLLILFTYRSYAQEGQHFKITLLRAAPGNLESLIEAVKQERTEANGDILIMRHNQGDHWDLMLLSPFEGVVRTNYSSFVDFQHDFIVRSETGWDQLKNKYRFSGLFHIEMFHAPRGKHKQLLEERKMENVYLQETEQDPNDIFITTFGSDVDLFTLGFYENMREFATPPDLTDEAFESAAQKAGFTSRSDIGFHLRKFILRHNDTLATPVD